MAVLGFAVSLITGSIGFPTTFPCPVGKRWTVKPAAAWRVTHSAAADDESTGGPDYGSTAGANGRVLW